MKALIKPIRDQAAPDTTLVVAGTDVAPTQMVRKVTEKSPGIRLGNYVQIRTIEDEELENVWGGKKTAKAALDSIVKRGNELLERFEKASKGG